MASNNAYGSRPAAPKIDRDRLGVKVIQIIDARNMLVVIEPNNRYMRETVWMIGYPTDGMVDGQNFRIYADRIDHLGPKQYESAFGVRTVRQVRFAGDVYER